MSELRERLVQALHEAACLDDEAPQGCGLADALLPVVAQEVAAAEQRGREAAWDEGYEAGTDDENFWARGLSTDSDAADHPHANPYCTEPKEGP